MKSDDTKPVETPASRFTLKVLGVGGAGGNLVEQLAQSYFPGVSFYALNTDQRALAGCATALTHPLGTRRTRGLGAGGDPEIGAAAAEENADQLRVLCAGIDVIVVATGLGGGTGTGASPVVARIARESGALVLAVATLPFDCEGTRRQQQARHGLEQLKAAADAVICLPNERVLKLIDDSTSLIETFKISNSLLAEGIRGVWRLLTRGGILNVDFADLCSVVRGRHAESCFAVVEARGENRSRDIVDKLRQSPFLDGGTVLDEAESVMVSLAGGPDLTMSEVNRVMAQINRGCDGARVVVGAAIEEEFTDRLSVTVIATRRGQAIPEAAVERARTAPAAPPPAADAAESGEPAARVPELGEQYLSPATVSRTPSRFIAPPPSLTPAETEQALERQHGGKPARKVRSRMRQGMLPLEIVSKGRFEKSEPTVYQGEDLDVPTYIRRGVALN